MKDKNHGVTVAPGAGFCPGVKKAIDCVLRLEASGKKPIYTIGPLIHNKQVTDMLGEKGISSIDKLEEAKDKNGVLVIRAHGITPEFQKEVESQGMEVVDSTCPLVKKVHNVIDEYAKQGYYTVIVGDGGHAEVIGLLGYTRGKGYVIANAEEAEKLPHFDRVNIVSQTTQKEETFFKAAEAVKKKADICQVNNTVCQPTKQRQKETLELAKNADLVIVVGGKHSANTARLAKLCGELCPKVLHVESAEEIRKEDVLPPDHIFITAGASTPNWVIDNVSARVKDLRKEASSLFGMLAKLWDFAVKSSLYTSFAAACLTYVCMKLSGAHNDLKLYLLSLLFVFTLTLANKTPQDMPSKAKRGFLIPVVLGGVLAFLTALNYGVWVWLPTLVFLILGAGAYPFRSKITLFSRLPGTKDIVTALGWCFVCIYTPAASQGLLMSKSAWLAFTYGLLLVFIRSVILSIGSERKDIMLGKESFYKAFGLNATKAAIGIIIIALTAVLIQLLIMGWKSGLVFMLLLGQIYTIAIAVYFYTKKTPRTTLSETFIDGQFLVLAVLTYLAVKLF